MGEKRSSSMADTPYKRIIDNYELLGKIADTQWGAVHRVHPIGLDRNFAMKLAKPGQDERIAQEPSGC